jgi:hypothetical protein
MKFACFILSIMILGLGLMPCKDTLAFNKTGFSRTFTERQNTSDPVKHDQCSPLCHCSCCNTPTVAQPNAVTFTAPEQPARKEYAAMLPVPIKSRIATIWQPPKLLS